MVTLTGTGACGGIAFGKLLVYRRGSAQVVRRRIEDSEAEVLRCRSAMQLAVEQLGELYQKALGQVGEQGALLFEIHQMMLEDQDYVDSVETIIRGQGVAAEYAVAVTADNFSRMFSEMEDPYMRERAADVRDISERLIGILQGEEKSGIATDRPVILAADDLSPSETIQMDKSKILAFVTSGGSLHSHTVILARTMGIPAVIGVGEELLEGYDGCDAIVDGATGQIYLHPDAETAKAMGEKWTGELEQKALYEQLKGKPNITPDGREVQVYANIGHPSDLGAVLQNDAGGIGLFRSEFLYLEREDYPTEEEQFAAYKTVAETMGGKRVIFRTLDIGADKQAPYFELPREENPALGLRAIRIGLTCPDVLKTQLRALYRASAFGNVAIMFPMVASLWEVERLKEMAGEVRASLVADGIPFSDKVELGIMIETPAAAILSDLLASEVDFFSIGTNDLTQYTLAVDRQNRHLEQFADPHHQAVLRLIETVAKNAREAGIWVGICGELAADPAMTETFLEMGIDELSVSPPAVLPLRARIRGQGNVAADREDSK